MRRLLSVTTCFVLMIPALAHADRRCDQSVDIFQPSAGIIGDTKVAESVAFTYLASIYGEAQIRRQLPLRTSQSDGAWIVQGTRLPPAVGGTAIIVICQRNGTVLRVGHSR